ncbi:MAG: NADH-quinone oxidoreductase subunit C [Chloroflexi bacterium]|nr:MAG: NADH-quinone oxidoreductase subunit C [Chloroflexota bacterium]
MEALIARLRERFPTAIQEVITFRGETTVVVPREALVEVCTYLRDEEGFNVLADLCAVDYLPRTPRFAVNYHLLSLDHRRRLRVKVFVEEEDPVVPTVTGVWPGANWHEREAFDLMRIRFEGHPDPRRILLPAEWEGHPLRKELPVVVEEIAYSFNKARIYAEKPFARE